MIRIERLTRAHRGLLHDFRNQHPSLVAYLRRFALRHADRDLLSRTFVALDDVEDGTRVAGYFSLCTASVARGDVDTVESLRRLPSFAVPAVLLARLAVDSRVQGQGLGRYLFEEALGRAIALASEGPVAFRLFATDAIADSAALFYERRGLSRLGDTFPCRMVLDLAGLLGAR